MFVVYEMRYPITLLLVCYIFADESDSNVVQSTSTTSSPTALFTTSHRASSEFAILLMNIIKELKKNESENLEIIKSVCLLLTVKDDPSVFLFNEEQQEAIDACRAIKTLLTKHLGGCWRWDDFTLLKCLVQSLESPGHCETMLRQYEQKLDSQMKLQKIYEHCLQEKRDFPDGFDKMVAIVRDKIFSRITKAEYDELQKFISINLRVESHVIPPFDKVSTADILCAW